MDISVICVCIQRCECMRSICIRKIIDPPIKLAYITTVTSHSSTHTGSACSTEVVPPPSASWGAATYKHPVDLSASQPATTERLLCCIKSDAHCAVLHGHRDCAHYSGACDVCVCVCVYAEVCEISRSRTIKINWLLN